MSERAPAFQWYPADYLADAKVQFLTSAQEGIYIRLLCYAWREFTIPAEPSQAIMICKRDAKLKDVTHVLDTMFVASPVQGRLRHDRLEEERKKQENHRQKCSEAGTKSARNRQRSFNDRSTTVEIGLNETSTNWQPKFSSSSSTSVFTPISPKGDSSIDDFNKHRRKAKKFHPLSVESRKQDQLLRKWIGEHSDEVIPRDHSTFSKISEAAMSDMSELDFYKTVDRISK